jgi:predicted acyltransferase
LFGLSFGGILKFNAQFRLMSVLGFIGIGWGIAAFVFMFVKRMSLRLLLAFLPIVGYWIMLSFFSAPNAPSGADTYSMEWNFISYLDRMCYPNHLLAKNVYEPESLFSVLNGAALALIGMCAGSVLKAAEISKKRKVVLLAVSSVVLLGLGFVFTLILGDQIVKKLWTSSFVLFTAAYSFAMLALFFWIIDVKGWRNWSQPFREIGMNSITVYLLMMFGFLGQLASFFFLGLAKWIGDPWTGVVIASARLLISYLVVHFLYRHKIFMRV